MLRAIVDTHAVIWYIFADPRLSVTAQATIEQIAADGDIVGFSSITLAEIIYLIEKSRIPSSTLTRLLGEVDRQDPVLVEIPFDRKIAQTMLSVDRTQIPDFPDRIIAATALYFGVPLISRDRKIQLSTVNTIW
ncbi:type II toxin-antitoxin system VapC family toxin [Planktothricoides raciborskii]|uniref:Ribonuclease VapC n=1 Tax=Planktothricoides raciborskii FACHB-1370 TaxID=2949576 RepID=A0ABR8EK78_9CYAN|nr:type II toxin-antitoxin system VapC family toxin [Planktothricoides raciborskii]MBD2547316.1 type II toxin-antitoxin system VapC family toxin [Planktothricoides raciborskii FACHB-1370]MBD2585212.1 type II toxin-antitoxin system VapC family toxin [Planktothricoides raciborskii FACHB-1261]